jgi:hypothetical protein
VDNLDVMKTEDLEKKLLNYLKAQFKNDSYWSKYLAEITASDSQIKPVIHLAIFIEPFLQFVLEGRKTIESRFSMNQCAPFNKVSKGDIVLIKKSGGPIVAACKISERWYYNLSADSWSEIKLYKDSLCVHDPNFWKSKKKASYATLMKINHVKELAPLSIEKRDRRGWIVITRIVNKQYQIIN